MRQTAWALALLGLLAMAGLMRPLLPIDETRYAAVAWEMWARSDFLVPHLNGEPYAHKPPLLFWIVQAGWALFGVNEWWPRLVSPVFAGGTMALAARLARELWPARPDAARIAPLVLVSSLLFSYFASALMFDAMLGFFVTLGFLGLARAWREQAVASGFVLLGLGLGGALLSKGPVALVHLLPAALLAPLWMREARPRWGRWYAGVGLAVLGGAALVLTWAIPAAIAGGEDYRAAIFWGQTAGRMVGSFAHKAAWWFYLASLPLMFMPWILWPRWWRGLGPALATGDSGVRLVVLGFLASLLLFSLVSGKQWQYLLPEFPLFALLVARTAGDGRAGRWSMAWPALSLAVLGAVALLAAPRLAQRLGGLDDASALVWAGALAIAYATAAVAGVAASAEVEVRRLACAAVAAFFSLLVAFDIAMREPYDTSAVASMVAQYQREGRPVAVVGDYHGEWTLAGRLRQPLELIDPRAGDWLATHPGGRVVFTYRKDSEIPAGARIEYSRRFRGRLVAILASP